MNRPSTGLHLPRILLEWGAHFASKKMRLTVDLVEGAAQHTNAATRDRELDLRGYKIPQIENLGATLDQFDCLDLSDNDIKKLENFPLLNRLTKLLLNNNRISKIGNIHESLPNLEWLILTNNEINSIDDIASLSSVKSLRHLSLLKNPIVTRENYRLSVIYHLPQIKVLDFCRVRLYERKAAAKQFKDTEKQLEGDVTTVHEFTPGEMEPNEKGKVGHTPEQIEAIKDAIAKASSLEEIERLNQALRSGYIPGTQ